MFWKSFHLAFDFSAIFGHFQDVVNTGYRAQGYVYAMKDIVNVNGVSYMNK